MMIMMQLQPIIRPEPARAAASWETRIQFISLAANTDSLLSVESEIAPELWPLHK